MIPVNEPQLGERWTYGVWWMYGALISEETGMDTIQPAQELAKRGVDTREVLP